MLSYVAPLWAAGLALATAMFLFDRMLRKFAAAPLLLAVGMLWVMMPGSVTSQTPKTDSPRLQVMTFNMHFANTRPQEVVSSLTAQRDLSIVALLEVSAANRPALDPLTKAYPYHIESGITDTAYGSMVLSKLPIQIVDVDVDALPKRSILVRVRDKDSTFLVLATHLFGPHSNFPQRHRDEAARLADFLAGVKEPIILLGDFNSTPWSGRLAAIAEAGDLAPVHGRFQWQPTWPAHKWWTCFPVDHIFVSTQDFAVAESNRGPRCGSDHYPLRADLSLVL